MVRPPQYASDPIQGRKAPMPAIVACTLCSKTTSSKFPATREDSGSDDCRRLGWSICALWQAGRYRNKGPGKTVFEKLAPRRVIPGSWQGEQDGIHQTWFRITCMCCVTWQPVLSVRRRPLCVFPQNMQACRCCRNTIQVGLQPTRVDGKDADKEDDPLSWAMERNETLVLPAIGLLLAQ
jgi:hypothetical protein